MNPAPYDIVLFDGECNFCNRSVQFIYDRDPKGIFRFASLQSTIGKQLLAERNVTIKEMSTMVLLRQQKAYTKSGAALRVCLNLKGLWPIMIIFLAVPPYIRNWVYDKVARNRHRLLKDKCAIPTGEFKARFLN